MDRSGANEDTYPLLVISRLITVTYLLFILPIWQGAKPRSPTPEFWFSTVTTICVFAETMSPMYFDYFAEIMSPMYLWLFWEPIADILFFGFSTCWSNVMDSGFNSIWQYWMLYIVFLEYFKRLYCKSKDLGWFARFRIQFLPDHIMIHSCLVCVHRYNQRF